MIHSLRAYKIIKGTRGQKGVNEDKFAEIIVRLSYTIVLRPESAGLAPEGALQCKVVLSCFMGAYQNYHVMVGDTLVKLTDYDPKNHHIYQVGDTCALTFRPDGVHIL